MDNYSLSDIAAASGNESGFGGANAWVLIILFALIYGNGALGGFGGNNGTRVGEAYATQADVQRAVDLDTLKNGQASISDTIRTSANDLNGSVKDVAYNNLSEIRDLQAAVSVGFADMQKCCCETQRAIDSVNYNGAINTASINANTTAQTQKILDAITTNRMADMQSQINNLQMQNALAGVVRYPMASTYNGGLNPFCGGSCSCGNV